MRNTFCFDVLSNLYYFPSSTQHKQTSSTHTLSRTRPNMNTLVEKANIKRNNRKSLHQKAQKRRQKAKKRQRKSQEEEKKEQKEAETKLFFRKHNDNDHNNNIDCYNKLLAFCCCCIQTFLLTSVAPLFCCCCCCCATQESIPHPITLFFRPPSSYPLSEKTGDRRHHGRSVRGTTSCIRFRSTDRKEAR